MSRTTIMIAITALALLLGTAGTVTAQDPGDIFLGLEDGKMITGQINDDQSIDVGVRVFGATFGDSGFPGFTSNPGFDALAGTFPVGTAVGFNALAGWNVWNGDGFEPAGGESLSISFATLNVIIEDEPVDGFQLNVQSNGGWHRHFDYFILGPDGDDPLPGIYLLEMELYSTSASIDPTEPFWKVFNHNMPTEVHQEAIDWVVENLAEADDCPADLDGNGEVDVNDLFILLSAWGECPGDCPADLDGNGEVNVEDLFMLLSAWGQCP